MQKSMFFMKTLRCTAGELYSTHKGTFAMDFGGSGSDKEWVFAPFDLEIIHIDDAANTVFFQSVEEVECPRYTGYVSGRVAHCDDKDFPDVCKVGRIVKQGQPFYKEGGKAGGVNGKYATHVHAVFASGKLLSPYWYNVGNGNYALKTDGHCLHIYDVMFVPDNVDIVATNDYRDDYPWQRVSEEDVMDISLFWEDEEYKLTAFEGNGLTKISDTLKMAQDYGDVKAISGGPFFDGSTILGRLQGLNCNRTHDQDLFDVAIDTDNIAHRGRLASWDFKDNARFGFTPRMMLIAGGVYSNEHGGSMSSFSDSYSDHFLFVVQDWSNRLALGVTRQKVSVGALRNFFLKEGMQYLWLCDGGGSTQLIGEGKTIAPEGTSRKLPAFFVLIKKNAEPEPKPEPEPTNEMTIVVDSVGMYVREKLEFSGKKPVGKKLAFVPIGGEAKVIKFIPGIQEDGYQWIESEYNGFKGVSQYDSTCYWIKQ